MAVETIDVAKSHTSYMDFKDNSQLFADIEKNPFNFQFVKPVNTLDEYHQLAYDRQTNKIKPLVVITSVPSMASGFSH